MSEAKSMSSVENGAESRRVDVLSPTTALARAILIHGPIQRGELLKRLQLTPPTLTRLSKPLLDSGLIVEAGETLSGTVGRPIKPLDIPPNPRRFLGVKLTSETAFGVVSDQRARAFARADRALASHDVADVIDAIVALFAQLNDDGQNAIAGVGVTVGGRVIDNRVVDSVRFLEWKSVDLGGALEARLGVPVTVENDLIALMEGEHWFGLGRSMRDFAVITIGAGVGYGLVWDDTVIRTAETGIELGGHLPLEPGGPRCFRGHEGCATAMLTVDSIRAQAQEATGAELSYEEILKRAAAGDPALRAVVDRAARALGRFIALAANLAMVHEVLLAGEGTGILDVARDEVLRVVQEERDPDADPISLVVDETGFGIWAKGAAAVAIQTSFDRSISAL
ncbi:MULTISPECIES: ROK family transcriptional regulator [unclassified Salinibacterium]|uniref:ROK family transcriptional regulator n=1 Tax=unclassified Salinibacterium TaxID=2632331 RepID=UPI0018CE8AEA|nr:MULTISPECIES: ROK family transcriptional regulator [unclassified Salinibacterium]MBH0052572.1 ROK family transcriptional regulator [Salinibacterium sp. SWN139]MBH0081836.1 ROK family transcriptional regulator [Salinibacterium sp. SWN167]